MPHSVQILKRSRRSGQKSGRKLASKPESRYTVGLAPGLANQVERYAGSINTSKSKAIAALVRLGLENQENRKRDFFKRLKENLANDDPSHQDRMVAEFRALILGR